MTWLQTLDDTRCHYNTATIIPEGFYAKRLLLRRVFIPKERYSENEMRGVIPMLYLNPNSILNPNPNPNPNPNLNPNLTLTLTVTLTVTLTLILTLVFFSE